MRVLVVDEWIPLPLNSGKKIRTFQLLSRYARQHELVYLCYADEKAEAAKITQMEEAGFRMVCVPPPPRKFDTPLKLALGFGLHCWGRLPLVVHKHYSRAFQKAVGDILGRERFDLVHCEWTHYGQFLQDRAEVPRFLSSHNVECVPWQRLYHVERNRVRRAALHLEWLKMRAFERRMISQFDHVAAVSAADAQLMKGQFAARSVEVIPNGVDVDFYGRPEHDGHDDVLAFCGSLDAFVNQDAVTYFCERILPRIWQQRPQVRLLIIGSSPPPRICKLAGDRILLKANAADVRPLLGQAAACVVPLRVAGGSRLKILEAFAAGIPVVSTTLGAEGLEVEAGRHLLIADREEAFAAETLRLLDDRPLRQCLVQAGRALVEEKYAWKAIVPLIDGAWQHTIDNFHSRGHSRPHVGTN